jgi:hypothetical protein
MKCEFYRKEIVNMTIIEACYRYENEKDADRKNQLKTAIINYCNKNQDAIIPDIAKKIYIAYLCGY